MRILHVAAPGPVGGLESVLVGLVLGLHRHGVDVHAAVVVSSEPDCHPVVRSLAESGVPVHPVVVPNRGYLRERREIGRLIRTLRPNVVHTHGHRSDVVDAGIARRLGVSTVTTLHGSSFMSWQTAIYERVQYRLLRRFQAVIAVSRPLHSFILNAGVPAERIHVIPNAWDGRFRPAERDEARSVLGLPRDGFVVGWVGRLIPVKGCDVFVKAMSRLRDVPVHASIIGNGPKREALETLVEETGLRDRVHFHGPRHNAAKLFRAFDIWVLSSRSEGTPMVLFEAMAAEVPIVATRVGGVEDVVSESEAFLVPPDDPDALASCIREIRSGRLCSQRRVAAARKRLRERFGTDKWVEQHVRLYQGLAFASEASPTRRGRPGLFRGFPPSSYREGKLGPEVHRAWGIGGKCTPPSSL